AAGEQAPATFELVSLTFSVPEDAKPEKYKEDAPIIVKLVDNQDKPLAGAKVTVDAERTNFARPAVTDANGQATITPLGNETSRHSVRLEKSGILTIDHADA